MYGDASKEYAYSMKVLMPKTNNKYSKNSIEVTGYWIANVKTGISCKSWFY